MADDGAKIIPLPGVDLDLGLAPKRGASLEEPVESPYTEEHGYGDSCPDFHRRGIVLRDTQRRAYCKTCGIEVDLFDYVGRLAQDWSWITRRHREATSRMQRVEARLEETLRLERNAKSRLKRTQEKLQGTG